MAPLQYEFVREDMPISGQYAPTLHAKQLATRGPDPKVPMGHFVVDALANSGQ